MIHISLSNEDAEAFITGHHDRRVRAAIFEALVDYHRGTGAPGSLFETEEEWVESVKALNEVFKGPKTPGDLVDQADMRAKLDELAAEIPVIDPKSDVAIKLGHAIKREMAGCLAETLTSFKANAEKAAEVGASKISLNPETYAAVLSGIPDKASSLVRHASAKVKYSRLSNEIAKGRPVDAGTFRVAADRLIEVEREIGDTAAFTRTLRRVREDTDKALENAVKATIEESVVKGLSEAVENVAASGSALKDELDRADLSLRAHEGSAGRAYRAAIDAIAPHLPRANDDDIAETRESRAALMAALYGLGEVIGTFFKTLPKNGGPHA